MVVPRVDLHAALPVLRVTTKLSELEARKQQRAEETAAAGSVVAAPGGESGERLDASKVTGWSIDGILVAYTRGNHYITKGNHR